MPPQNYIITPLSHLHKVVTIHIQRLKNAYIYIYTHMINNLLLTNYGLIGNVLVFYSPV